MPFSESHQPQVFLKKISGQPNEGEEIVQHYCANCHAEKPIISVGAPKIRNLSDWKLRTKDFKLLFSHVEEGMGLMPARGGCFECTDHQLMLAIIAMLPPKLMPKDEVKK